MIFPSFSDSRSTSECPWSSSGLSSSVLMLLSGLVPAVTVVPQSERESRLSKTTSHSLFFPPSLPSPEPKFEFEVKGPHLAWVVSHPTTRAFKTASSLTSSFRAVCNPFELGKVERVLSFSEAAVEVDLDVDVGAQKAAT